VKNFKTNVKKVKFNRVQSSNTIKFLDYDVIFKFTEVIFHLVSNIMSTH